MTSRFEGRDMAIGLDSAILIGHESVIAASLIIVPIAIVMSIVVPGNRMLWGVDLATFPFFFAMMVPVMDGDVVRMVLTGIVLLVPTHYIAGWVAPLMTDAAVAAEFDLGEAELITAAIGDAGSPATGILAIPAQEAGVAGLYFAIAFTVVFTLLIWAAVRVWPRRMYELAGASEEKAEEHVQLRHTGENPGVLPNKLGEPIEPEPEDAADEAAE